MHETYGMTCHTYTTARELSQGDDIKSDNVNLAFSFSIEFSNFQTQCKLEQQTGWTTFESTHRATNMVGNDILMSGG